MSYLCVDDELPTTMGASDSAEVMMAGPGSRTIISQGITRSMMTTCQELSGGVYRLGGEESCSVRHTRHSLPPA